MQLRWIWYHQKRQKILIPMIQVPYPYHYKQKCYLHPTQPEQTIIKCRRVAEVATNAKKLLYHAHHSAFVVAIALTRFLFYLKMTLYHIDLCKVHVHHIPIVRYCI